MFWLLLVVLAVIGGATAVTVTRRRALPGGGAQKALPDPSAPGGDKLLERTVRDLRVGDVVTIDGKDFVCEGVIDYDEDGHRWKGGRVVDGSEERWAVLGLERLGSTQRLCSLDSSTPITGYPPEAIVIGETRFVQDKRGTATCSLSGELGGLSELKKGRPDGHVERCRWWLYAAPGDDTLIVEQWGSDYRVLKGKKIGDGIADDVIRSWEVTAIRSVRLLVRLTVNHLDVLNGRNAPASISGEVYRGGPDPLV